MALVALGPIVISIENIERLMGTARSVVSSLRIPGTQTADAKEMEDLMLKVIDQVEIDLAEKKVFIEAANV